MVIRNGCWRRRYGERGVAGLDAPRSGRPRRRGHRQIMATTVETAAEEVLAKANRPPPSHTAH